MPSLKTVSFPDVKFFFTGSPQVVVLTTHGDTSDGKMASGSTRFPVIDCDKTYDVKMLHDDVIKWNHFPCYWPFVRGIHRSPVNSPHKGQWRGALMFSLICARINGWVNNLEAGDLRRHRAYCDVIVMVTEKWHQDPLGFQWLIAIKHVIWKC